MDWFDTLEYFGVDTANKNWNRIKERFKQDYNAKPTPHTSVKAFKGFKYLVTLIIKSFTRNAIRLITRIIWIQDSFTWYILCGILLN